jgi:hypothetical protein
VVTIERVDDAHMSNISATPHFGVNLGGGDKNIERITGSATS